jgi:glycosyltransferase involved in cell wall biosynthesis
MSVGSLPADPVISVITATYNWSSALRCAIESVLLQTFAGFEMIVVGDGCTDDSGEVVASFGDPRLRWVNLPENSGSQSIPNNYGASIARGEFVAYLGHDDVWYPTHLEAVLRCARTAGADVVHSVAIVYGPPGSGVRSTTGIFASGEFGSRDFGAPSAMLIRRELLTRVGPWRDPSTLADLMDVDLERRAFSAGARFAATNELTVFKFSAAWRRDCYRLRPDIEQRATIERIKTGNDFRPAELVDVIRSYIAGKAVTIEIGAPPAEQGASYRLNALYKGVATREPRRLEATERFTLDDQIVNFDFYDVERDEAFGSFRWTGPAIESHVELPVTHPSGMSLRMHVFGHVQDDPARDIWIACDGVRAEGAVEATADGHWLLTAAIPPRNPRQPLRFAIHVARTARPIDLGVNEDRRWLGVAINWIEMSPLDAPAAP